MKNIFCLTLFLTSFVSECGINKYSIMEFWCPIKQSCCAIERQVAQTFCLCARHVPVKVWTQHEIDRKRQECYWDIIDRMPNTRYTIPLKRLHAWQRLRRWPSR